MCILMTVVEELEINTLTIYIETGARLYTSLTQFGKYKVIVILFMKFRS